MTKPNTISIDDVEYIRKDSIDNNAPAKDLDGLKYVIVRSKDSGCHAGYEESNNNNGSITLLKSRRLWYWSGAASLSELAMHGVSNPDECKFPCEVDEMTIYRCCERLNVTEKARLSINGVSVWKG